MNSNETHLRDLLESAKQALYEVSSIQELEFIRVNYLGKKGKITEQLKQIGSLAVEQRKEFGQRINQVKLEIQNLLDTKKGSLQAELLLQEAHKQTIDVTLPGRNMDRGALHPVSKTIQRIEDIFDRLGFDLVSGPEIEDDYHNFEALNIPPNHPARAMHDTFYISDHVVLRTHTSTVQIRFMENNGPPIKVVASGKVYRCDSDVTHTPMFHQLEGLVVEKGITFADLKGVLIFFIQEFFEKDLPVRFRPSYFPFTEPSAEVDMGCGFCEGKGCRICKQTGWIEVLGSGMVHPRVLENGGINSNTYTGYAFGLGIERFAMLKYGVSDLRLFFNNDLTFLRQFV